MPSDFNLPGAIASAVTSILDANGAQIGHILAAAAAKHGIPLLLLLTCGIGESNLTPIATRHGVWPDVSVGPFQQTVLYAKGYGIGDGCDTPANIAACEQAFSDWNLASEVAAQHLQGTYTQALADGYAQNSDYAILAALSAYNAGSIQEYGNWWWSSPQRANYVAALTRAKQILGLQ